MTLAPVCSTWVFMCLALLSIQHFMFCFVEEIPKSGAVAIYFQMISPPRSRGSTHRSMGRPLGKEDAPSVSAGNLMVARVALLLFLCSCKGLWWVVEQPRGSLLEFHPMMQQVFKRIRTWRQHVKMADFAADTEKGTWLYSSTFV